MRIRKIIDFKYLGVTLGLRTSHWFLIPTFRVSYLGKSIGVDTDILFLCFILRLFIKAKDQREYEENYNSYVQSCDDTETI